MQNKDEFTPQPDRPRMPDGYGIPPETDSLLTWDYVEDRMKVAKNFWISTTRPDGRPHAMPVWGVWLDNRFYFDGSPETRRGRNLEHNPALVVHLENGDEVVVLEGKAKQMNNPGRILASKIAEAYCAKYEKFGYAPKPDQWDEGGLYEMSASVVFAWSEFPKDCTRWTINNE